MFAASTPLPIVSTGTLLETDEGVSSRVVMRARAAVPQETFSDIMNIDRSRFSVLWRPNNYRRKSRLKFAADIGSYPISTQYRNAVCGKKGLWVIRDYDRVTVMLGPNVVRAIWSQRVINGAKEHFLLESDSAAQLRSCIASKTEEIRVQLDRVLVDVAERLGLKVDEPVWDRFEDFFRDSRLDELVAKLPRGCVVHESFFKKVYDEGVEFVQSVPGEGPGVRLSSYLKNRAFEDVAPEVAVEIAALRRDVAQRFLLLTRSIERLEKAPAGSLHEASKAGQKKLGRWTEVSDG